MRFSYSIPFWGLWLTGQCWVSGEEPYPKPSIWVHPGETVALGGSVNIHCKSDGYTRMQFHLQKQYLSDFEMLRSEVADRDEVVFPIVNATLSDAGIYRCIYCYKTHNCQMWSRYSHSVNISVRGKSRPKFPTSMNPSKGVTLQEKTISGDNPEVLGQSKAIIGAGAAAGSLVLILLLLLLAFVLYTKRKRGSTANEQTQALPMKETNLPLEPEAEGEAEDDPDGVSYAVLNHYSLKRPEAAKPDSIPESCVYASVANGRTRWWLTGQKWLARGQTFPKPSISVSPRTAITRGGNVDIHCQTNSYSWRVFELYKVAPKLAPKLQRAKEAQKEVTFHIPNAQTANGGFYICRYCSRSDQHSVCSVSSDIVKIFITGQLYPAPSLSASPSTIVTVGGNVTISCKRDKHPNTEFHLYKDRSLSTLAAMKKTQNEIVFFIASATLSDGGIYQCKYCLSTDVYELCSYYSSSTHIFIRDPCLPKPSIKACPSQEVAPGLKVIIECQGPEKGLNFSLYKSSTLIASQITEPNSSTTKFSFSMVNSNNTGNYTCQYHNRTRPFVWSSPSDPIQIVVRDKDPVNLDKRLILAGAAAGSLFLALLLLLLAFTLYRKRKKGSTANERPPPLPVKETNLPQEPEAEEDPSGISYAVLKLQSPRTMQAANPDRVPESCVYASVANDRTRMGRKAGLAFLWKRILRLVHTQARPAQS